MNNKNRTYKKETPTPKYKQYNISADGGKTFTTQWLTEDEKNEHINKYHFIVEETTKQ